ncbi:MAG: hypothetical protein SGARI_002110, partial [Bacillariaceae sp.]
MTFVSLPSVLKRRVTSFLDYRSAIALSRNCHKMHSALSLLPLEPRYELVYSTIAHDGDVMTGDVPVKSVQIPIFYQNPQSVVLKCQWKDQGWGNRKGRIYVVEHHDNDESRHRTETEDDDQRAIDDLFEGGKVVYKSPVATHDLEPLEISFVPKPAKSSDRRPPRYHLWFVVGGGGGHSLTIEN